MGFWGSGANLVSPETDALHDDFVAVSPIPKYLLPVGSEITIADGYQVRVIYFDYSFNQYTVLYRTANQTGVITLDDVFWGDYEYVGFNISKVVSEDLSGGLDALHGLLTLN